MSHLAHPPPATEVEPPLDKHPVVVQEQELSTYIPLGTVHKKGGR